MILATGFKPFDPRVIPEYGYGKYKNVLTGLEFERMNSASGPTGGKILLANGQEPKRSASSTASEAGTSATTSTAPASAACTP